MSVFSSLAGWWARNRYDTISYHGTTKGLKTYYRTQIRQSVGKANKDAQFRYNRMIDRLLHQAQLNNLSANRVLCLGARNTYEINALRQAGFGNVVGIDLFSGGKEILIMDMHDLNFPANSFDVVFSGDSFEHAHTPRRVAEEIARVLKPGGYVCMSTPIQWRRAVGRENEPLSRLADCQDFTSKEEVYAYFPAGMFAVVYDELYKFKTPVDNLLTIMQKRLV
jgi:SAM-dependent methyltransferase